MPKRSNGKGPPRLHVVKDFTPEEIAKLLGARRTGPGQWSAHCPHHEDNHESLSIGTGEGNKLLLNCHVGCEFVDLMADINELAQSKLPLKKKKTDTQKAQKKRGAIDCVYDYHDETGEIEFRVVRYKDPKGFSQQQPDGMGGWTNNAQGVRKVIYRLPKILAADPTVTVYFVEGEKDVRSLIKMGLQATTSAMGAANWHETAEEAKRSLTGRHVVIIPDNDKSGRKYACQIIETLHEVAASVRVLELPGLDDKGDVSDWIVAGGTREQLLELVRNALPGAAWAGNHKDEATTEDEGPDSSPFAKWSSLENLKWLDIDPPPREHLLLTNDGKGYLPSHVVGLAVGAGGLGKSYALLSLSLAVSTGRMWLGTYPVTQPGHVAILAGEEDEQELWRRLRSAAGIMKLTPAQRALAAHRIVPLALHGLHVQLQKGADAEGAPNDTFYDLEDRLMNAGVEWKLIIIDPASRFGSVDLEKDNAIATRFIQMLETLAKVPGCPTVIVAHHTNKTSRTERGTATSARGASSLTDGARWVVNLDPVIQKSGMPGLPRLVNLHVTKANNVGIHRDLILVNDPDFDGALRPATDDEKAADARAAEACAEDDAVSEDEKIDAMILAALIKNPCSSRELWTLGNHDKVQGRLSALELTNVIRRDGPKKPWRLVRKASDQEPDQGSDQGPKDDSDDTSSDG